MPGHIWRHNREIGNVKSLFKFVRVVCEVVHWYHNIAVIESD